jgi:DNA-binding winged helix-turn-helix (wHTH) protein
LLCSFEEFSLDTARRELRRSGTLISLQPQVFDVLEYLIRNRERVVSKDDLLATVWDGRIVSESTVSTRINAARRAVGDNGEEQRLIRTTYGKGIRFVGAVCEQDAVGVAGGLATAEQPDKPSIAVLPLENLSGDPEQD